MKILDVWSKFQKEIFDGEKNIWKPYITYYMGDLSEVDLTTDWRFCEVKNKRKLAILLEIVANPFN